MGPKDVLAPVPGCNQGTSSGAVPGPSAGHSAGTEAVDQFRRLVSEFQKSEIYDFMKSFSSLYTQAMAPVEGVINNDVSTNTSQEMGRQSDEKERVSKETERESMEAKRLADTERDAKEKAAMHPGTTHNGVVCDSCDPKDDKSYITGWRYKCLVCDNFDLCSQCYTLDENLGAHSSQHAMVAIEDSQSFSQFLKCRGLLVPRLHNNVIRRPFLWGNGSQPTASDNSNIESDKKAKEDAQIMADASRKYQELSELVEGDAESKFEILKALVLKAQEAESEPKQDSVMEEEIAERETEDSEETESPGDVNEMAIASTETLLAELAVIPKGKSLSQVLISNKSPKTIDCEGLTLAVVNCFDMTVASIPIEKRMGIAPNRTSKFNVTVSNTHFKYPFKIVLSSAKFAGECSLSLKNMSGKVSLVHKLTEERGGSLSIGNGLSEHSQMEDATRHGSCSSTPSFATASVHSILLPSLPKEVQSMAAANWAHNTINRDVTMSDEDEEADNDDYDLISVTEAEDLDSDYEILAEGDSFE
ncbi:hypothetical protein JCM33374_g4305 [Metschnikowia sp. JCM 33374]|nr:hypothetical protein JCM33374_g4305 [Metschnikowia sp. JCM 33374]